MAENNDIMVKAQEAKKAQMGLPAAKVECNVDNKMVDHLADLTKQLKIFVQETQKANKSPNCFFVDSTSYQSRGYERRNYNGNKPIFCEWKWQWEKWW
ncbi:hypothetical protein PNQ69_20710 [Xanthomonas sp. A2111]|uniref:Transposase n=1 Tax=Xanthomonas hawaiiensis TaxID=3003247 RepID=A0ABU2IBP2_9XANT|nr:hypothetical protein [Xanthomonas sp. A2111]MDS9995187.1 hypothetical protein [Xanthomonas sp. A2111]